ncbi:ubiquitin-like protein Pup [Euzebya tangerina]|uniref:ubiquitin-like protein Pup n=1 Tax=Euzebya tangerina TaxID=591198 RepID=UPI000E30DE5A|nr:ubiquitin-like protein Pup [Euzebya tangerina]
MSDGGQVRKQKGKQTEEQDATVDSESPEVDTSDVDDLLDEIDGVLEENAEEFVKNYVQKGGE